ncbi:hypothetical protein HYS96_01735 [Candidatus Daviesbacteria bacterium]|nr:hypothetical protein [Candidatus Daviesbacteria bacterium]
MKFKSKKPHYEYLKKKFKARHRSLQEKFWDKHGEALKQIALGSLGGLLLLSPPTNLSLPFPNLTTSKDDALKSFDKNVLLAAELEKIVPKDIRPLSKEEEREITGTLSRNFGLAVLPELEGVRLNRNYGLIGGEQHLYRYPGDNLYAHAENTSDWAKYGSSGIAPSLGAWGYFTPSKEEFSELDKSRERYYLAIQTFLIPGFAENVSKFRDFLKFRKMLVVNPKSGQAVVAIIGDAGPAEWTGKHLGGSPEVMDILGLAGGMRKGPVLYFFINDPEDKIPLGPIKVVNNEA